MTNSDEPIRRKPKVAPWPKCELNDRGNAERLALRYADRLRWMVDLEQWAAYDCNTGLWSLRGEKSAAMGLMRKVFEEMLAKEGPNYSKRPDREGEDSEYEEFKKFCGRQGSTQAIKNALHMATSKRPLKARIADFNASTNLLHCENGVLDLDALKLLGHSPTHYQTISTRTIYRAGARSRGWQSFIERILPDAEVRRWVQKAFGYSLIDGNPEKLFLIAKGPRDTGKTTINEVIMSVLGDYAGVYDMTLLKAATEEKARPDMARALPRRYISTEEASSAWALHADQIKRVTGGATLRGRFPYDKADTERVPAFTPWLFTNEMPVIKRADEAFYRRMIVIPFEVQIPRAQQDPKAARRMKTSERVRSAVLDWLVEGLRAYLAEGLLDVPASLVQATEAAKSSLSMGERFLKEVCRLGERETVRPDEIMAAYELWCERSRIRAADVLTRPELADFLDEKGFKTCRPRWAAERVRVRVGLSLKKPVRGKISINRST